MMDIDKFIWNDGDVEILNTVSQDAAFKEEDHPRDKTGEFVDKAGGGAVLRPAPADKADWPAHIRALKIPPAWTDLYINHDPDGALLVVGKDVKGREQYCYSAKYHASQSAAKFERIRELSLKYDNIHHQNEANRKDPELKEVADLTALIMHTGIRPGGTEKKGDVKAYGATTLQGRHVKIDIRGNVKLLFVGKHGVKLNIPVTDPDLAAMLKERKEQAGPQGKLFDVSSHMLLGYVHTLDGGGFKTKDFRTTLGTKTALEMLHKVKTPKTPIEYKKAVRKVAKAVSEKLGNTPVVALTSYIDPTVFGGWRHAAGV